MQIAQPEIIFLENDCITIKLRCLFTPWTVNRSNIKFRRRCGCTLTPTLYQIHTYAHAAPCLPVQRGGRSPSCSMSQIHVPMGTALSIALSVSIYHNKKIAKTGH